MCALARVRVHARVLFLCAAVVMLSARRDTVHRSVDDEGTEERTEKPTRPLVDDEERATRG